MSDYIWIGTTGFNPLIGYVEKGLEIVPANQDIELRLLNARLIEKVEPDILEKEILLNEEEHGEE